MKLGVLLGYSGKRIQLPMDLIKHAERLGYDSVWTAEASGDGDGTIRLRISECPAGFALVRKQSNPLSDTCTECPGTSDHAYSLVPALWNGNADETNLDDFCLKCPTPPSSVKCWGGTNGNHFVSGFFASVPLPVSSSLPLFNLYLSLCQ